MEEHPIVGHIRFTEAFISVLHAHIKSNYRDKVSID